MPEERPGTVTLGGNPMTLIGPRLRIGDTAPDFTAIGTDFNEVNMPAIPGKTRVFLSVTSLDTHVCETEAKKFSDMAAKFPPDVDVYVVSVDLPPAQKRWCGATKVANITPLSDHKSVSFGEAYGTLVKEIRQLSRAVFVVDGDGVIQYVEYVKEIGDEPDYEAAAEAVKKVAGTGLG